MNDILFGNNNSKVITKLYKRYFKKNKVRNLAALLAIILTAFLFTMQSIGMTGKQLRRLMVYEGIYYAVGADIIGGAVAAILAVTVLKSALNGPSMWFFTLNITLVPVLVIGVLYLLLAAVIPLSVLHFFNKGTVVERLRTSE